MSEALITLLREGLVLAVLLVAPLLVAAAAAGLLAALVTRVTQLEDATVTLVARVAAVVLVLALLGPSIAGELQASARRSLASIAALGAS